VKISRLERITFLLAAVFLAFTAGWFLRGSKNAEPVRIETARTPSDKQTADLPTPSPSAPAVQININTADSAALQTLPGIGEKRAQAIIEFRIANGPFRTTADLTQVSGIGARMLEELEGLICV